MASSNDKMHVVPGDLKLYASEVAAMYFYYLIKDWPVESGNWMEHGDYDYDEDFVYFYNSCVYHDYQVYLQAQSPKNDYWNFDDEDAIAWERAVHEVRNTLQVNDPVYELDF